MIRSDFDTLSTIGFLVCLGVYLLLLAWMRRAVSNPPAFAYGVILVGVGGVFPFLAHVGSLWALLSYLAVFYGALVVVMVTTFTEKPRSGYHLTASF